MKALVLAAGIGSRLKLQDIPKPMYEVNGKPVLEHNIMLLKKHNINDICITLHYKGEVIKNYFEDGSKWGVKIQYSYEKELMGTSGALLNAVNFLDESPFYVLYGDNYSDTDLTKMFKFYEANKPIATIALFDPQKALHSGIAGGKVLLAKDNSVISFVEGGDNQSKGYVNSGIYILENQIFDMIPKNPPSDFGKDIFPMLLKQGYKLKGFVSGNFVLAIDTKEALKITERALKEKGLGK